jgi:excisionase family DNA binding protein
MQLTNSAAASETTVASGLGQPQFKLMYSKKEAAAILSLSVRTIENLVANKELTVRRVGKRVLIPYQSLVQFSKGNHQTGRNTATLN